jgi:hypothetical protein
VNIDDMSADQIARYVADGNTRSEVNDIASRLQSYESTHPGTILAVLGMRAERRSNFIWSLRSGSATSDVDLLCANGTIYVQASSNHGAMSWREVTPTANAAPVALVNGGHCPAGSECDECQWEAMTPEERKSEDARYADKAKAVGGRNR